MGPKVVLSLVLTVFVLIHQTGASEARQGKHIDGILNQNSNLPTKQKDQQEDKDQHNKSSSLHEHDELGLCSAPDPIKRLEKRSYLPPVSCTDAHEIEAVTARVHCQPRPRVVALPWPNDTSVHQQQEQMKLQHLLLGLFALASRGLAWDNVPIIKPPVWSGLPNKIILSPAILKNIGWLAAQDIPTSGWAPPKPIWRPVPIPKPVWRPIPVPKPIWRPVPPVSKPALPNWSPPPPTRWSSAAADGLSLGWKGVPAIKKLSVVHIPGIKITKPILIPLKTVVKTVPAAGWNGVASDDTAGVFPTWNNRPPPTRWSSNGPSHPTGNALSHALPGLIRAKNVPGWISVPKFKAISPKTSSWITYNANQNRPPKFDLGLVPPDWDSVIGDGWKSVISPGNWVDVPKQPAWNNLPPIPKPSSWTPPKPSKWTPVPAPKPSGWTDVPVPKPSGWVQPAWEKVEQSSGWKEVPKPSGWVDAPFKWTGWQEVPKKSGWVAEPVKSSGWKEVPKSSGWVAEPVKATGWKEVPKSSGWVDTKPAGPPEKASGWVDVRPEKISKSPEWK